ncbi:MAG TPA: hypothetical protein VGC87_07060 [Pyrinomonadaceae bacterium]|jgi:hypothetical protein
MVQQARAGRIVTNVGAWCVAALLGLPVPAWAGATLRGVVVRDREHGPPMAGVELTAPGEARKNDEEALSIYREFAARTPASYQQHVQEVEQNLRAVSP